MKRQGSAAINSSAISGTPAVHGLADWQTDAGQRSLVVTAGTKIFKANDLGSTLTDITGAVTITSGQNNQSTFASLNNLLVRCGGATPDAPIKWSGAGNAAALGGTPPSGNICRTANNFMFISGIAATPSRVYWSNAIDPETWSASDYVNVRGSDGDRVTALIDRDANLLIFKRRSIHILWTSTITVSGSVTLGPLVQIPNAMGCVGPLAIDKLPDGRIVYMGSDGHVYMFDGAQFDDISNPPLPRSNIQPTLDALPAGRLPYAVVRCYPTRNQVWISVTTTGTTNNEVIVYDYALNCWLSPFTSIAANVMCSVIDTRTTPSHPSVMVTGNYGGLVYEQDTGTTNAEDTNGTIDAYGTISVQIGDDSTDFVPRSVVVPLESQTRGDLEMNYGYNGYTTVNKTNTISQMQLGGLLDQFILDTSILGGPSTLRSIQRVGGTGRAYSMQVQFRNRNASETFTVHPIKISDEVIV